MERNPDGSPVDKHEKIGTLGDHVQKSLAMRTRNSPSVSLHHELLAAVETPRGIRIASVPGIYEAPPFLPDTIRFFIGRVNGDPALHYGHAGDLLPGMRRTLPAQGIMMSSLRRGGYDDAPCGYSYTKRNRIGRLGFCIFTMWKGWVSTWVTIS